MKYFPKYLVTTQFSFLLYFKYFVIYIFFHYMQFLFIQKTVIYNSLSNPGLFTFLQILTLLKGCPIASWLSFGQNSIDYRL